MGTGIWDWDNDWFRVNPYSWMHNCETQKVTLGEGRKSDIYDPGAVALSAETAPKRWHCSHAAFSLLNAAGIINVLANSIMGWQVHRPLNIVSIHSINARLAAGAINRVQEAVNLPGWEDARRAACVGSEKCFHFVVGFRERKKAWTAVLHFASFVQCSQPWIPKTPQTTQWICSEQNVEKMETGLEDLFKAFCVFFFCFDGKQPILFHFQNLSWRVRCTLQELTRNRHLALILAVRHFSQLQCAKNTSKEVHDWWSGITTWATATDHTSRIKTDLNIVSDQRKDLCVKQSRTLEPWMRVYPQEVDIDNQCNSMA